MSGPRDLSRLFSPDSIAIIGASDDPRKWGNWMAKGALRGEHRRRVHLVNHTRELGPRPAEPRSASDIPGGVELAVITVPAAAFADAVDDALLAGARAIVGISAGLGETGPGRPRARTGGRPHEFAKRGPCCSVPTASACSTSEPSSISRPTIFPTGRSASSPRAATWRSSWARRRLGHGSASAGLPRPATRPISTSRI